VRCCHWVVPDPLLIALRLVHAGGVAQYRGVFLGGGRYRVLALALLDAAGARTAHAGAAG
jgi:hypothetical protein